jgi:Raf kinase inhibitor-like YbhB/YbcL family protein
VNIPADVSELTEGAGSTGGKLPAGALQTRTDFGVPGYGGPCPPEGDHPHRYLFTVFAVKTDKRCKGRYISGGRRVQFAFQYAGEGGDHGII